MRRPRIGAPAVLVVLAVLSVSGCTAAAPVPTGPSQAELDTLVRAELDRQWGFTGLDGVVPRPDVAVEELGSPDGFSEGFGTCMSAAGFNGWGVGDTGLDMSMVNPDGAPTTPDQQLAYYLCIARFPNVDLLSDEQLDFVYDYYQRWLIPCLEEEGFHVATVPTREEFHDYRKVNGWRWAPYSSLATPAEGAEFEALLAKCKPTVGGMDGWSMSNGLY